MLDWRRRVEWLLVSAVLKREKDARDMWGDTWAL